MSTVNLGSAVPAGTNIIGQVKLVDTGGVNQASIDANNNLHVALYSAANSMAIDASNNAHVGIWNGANQLAVSAGGAAAVNLAQVAGSAIALGQTTMAASVPVVIASNQSAVVTDGISESPTGAAVPASASYIGGNKAGNLTGLSLDGSGNLNVNIAAGAGSGGTASTFGAAFPASGTAAGASDGTNMQPLLVESATNKNLRTGLFAGATQASIFAPGELRVALEPTQLFQDAFDHGLDTVNRWKAPTWGGGGIAALNEATDTRLGTGTQPNGWSCLESQFAFAPTNPGWIEVTMGNNVPYPYIPNTYFFWGIGTSPALPTAALPIVDGAGFEIAIGGRLFAVMYQGGVRQMIADLSLATGSGKQPQSGSVHYYTLFYRGDHTYWCIDGLDNVVAQTLTGAPGPNVNTLPLKLAALAGAGAPTANGQLVCNTVHVSDTARNNIQISDGTYPWRQVTVDAQGNLAVKDAANAMTTGTLQIAATANGNGTPVNVTGLSVVTLTVTAVGASSYAATVNFEGTEDGVNYFGLATTALGTNVFGNATTNVGAFQADCSGLQFVRARISNYQSGKIAVTAHALLAPFSTPVMTLSGASGKLALSAGSLSANADNPITFSGASTVARRVRIQNESAGTIYWDADVTATLGSPSLVSPVVNAVSVEWVSNIPITTLHIFIPSGGTTVLNGTGGVKVSAWA